MNLKELQKEADQLWATVNRKPCESCGAKDVSPHHIVLRRNKALRWSLTNRIWLCLHCHRSAHDYPMDFLDWVKKDRPEDFEYLMKTRNIISKFTEKDMKLIIRKLNEN